MEPLRHTSDLLSVGGLISIRDEGRDGWVSENDVGAVFCNTVIWIQEGLSTHPYGAPVFRVSVKEADLPILTSWGAHQEVCYPVAHIDVKPQIFELN